MKLNAILAFTAGGLFLVAGILSFVNGNSSRGIIGCIGALSFLLAGIHWGRNNARKS
jgi:hypothetical protein